MSAEGVVWAAVIIPCYDSGQYLVGCVESAALGAFSVGACFGYRMRRLLCASVVSKQEPQPC